MSAIFMIFEGILLSAGLVFFLIFSYTFIRFYWFFYRRKCKHCNHHLDYRGLRDDKNNGHYLFHCSKCGAWEQVPRKGYFYPQDDATDETKNF